jgi:hypothetical protein
MAVNETLFPDLVRTGYQVTSPADAVYNCIAYAVGVTDNWWWPDPDGFDYWPAGVVRDCTLAAFIQAFATQGYTPCPDGSLEPGSEKVAIYANDEGPTHAACQLASGGWTSKLGPDEDIEHTLEGLCSPLYGSVVQFLRRRSVQP